MASDGVEIMEMLEAMYQAEHEYVQVSEADFQYLDLKFYNRVTTELSNGMSIMTSNAKVTEVLGHSERILLKCHSKRTSYQKLLESHQDSVSRYLLENPNVAPLEIRTRAEMLASKNRMNVIKSIYRGALGIVTKEELIALSNGKTHVANELWAEIEKYSKVEDKVSA